VKDLIFRKGGERKGARKRKFVRAGEGNNIP
jgi:hypothetical protein